MFKPESNPEKLHTLLLGSILTLLTLGLLPEHAASQCTCLECNKEEDTGIWTHLLEP
jgi:hypothetical protein